MKKALGVLSCLTLGSFWTTASDLVEISKSQSNRDFVFNNLGPIANELYKLFVSEQNDYTITKDQMIDKIERVIKKHLKNEEKIKEGVILQNDLSAINSDNERLKEMDGQISRAISFENMQKIANRYASQNSLIHVLNSKVTKLIETANPDQKLFKEIKTIIEKLLSDEEPNKDWIFGMINDLKFPKHTNIFYQQLEELIRK